MPHQPPNPTASAATGQGSAPTPPPPEVAESGEAANTMSIRMGSFEWSGPAEEADRGFEALCEFMRVVAGGER